MAKKKRLPTVPLVPPRGPATNLRPAGAHDDDATVYDRKKEKAALRREIAESGFPLSGQAPGATP